MVNYINCNDLTSYKNNSGTHSKAQINQIAGSIRAFGFTNPILIDGNKNIIAGHGRIEGAKLVGLKKVPTIMLEHLSDEQKAAYIIADNKIAENAGWDIETLQSELEYITELDIDFDMTLTGFNIPEIDILMQGNKEQAPEDATPELPEFPVSKPGDIWILGPHKILCADSTKPDSYTKLMGSDKAQLIFTDPPYNVPVNGHICGKGKIKHEEFKMGSGEMSQSEFISFLSNTFKNLCSYSVNGSLHYICMDWRHIGELLEAGKHYQDLLNLCIWNKTNGGMGSLYRSKHELVFVYKNGVKPHINNIQLGKHGRYRTNVWDYAGINTFGKTGELKMHPTVKPVAMIEDAILDCSKRNDIVLDVFGGSGSTLIAAERSGRKAYLMEFDPKYIDVIIKRYEQTTGKVAFHEDNCPFSWKKEVRHGQR